MSINLGDKVIDKVSGFTGIVTGRAEYLNGCVQLLIRPSVDKDGKMVDGHWIDDNQLTVETKNALKAIKKKTGGPMDTPSMPLDSMKA